MLVIRSVPRPGAFDERVCVLFGASPIGGAAVNLGWASRNCVIAQRRQRRDEGVLDTARRTPGCDRTEDTCQCSPEVALRPVLGRPSWPRCDADRQGTVRSIVSTSASLNSFLSICSRMTPIRIPFRVCSSATIIATAIKMAALSLSPLTFAHLPSAPSQPTSAQGSSGSVVGVPKQVPRDRHRCEP
jgi:hypothetical protein